MLITEIKFFLLFESSRDDCKLLAHYLATKSFLIIKESTVPGQNRGKTYAHGHQGAQTPAESLAKGPADRGTPLLAVIRRQKMGVKCFRHSAYV